MVPNAHTLPFELQAADTDFAGRWKPASILSYMQILADKHAELLQCSQRNIEPEGVAWVIARLRVDMERYPVYGDNIRMTTWPGRPDRLTFPRYFKFEDAAGSLCGTATSKYMMIRIATHEFVKPADTDVYRLIDQLREEENPQPERIRLKEPTRPVVWRAPAFSDIDMNRHMNNARYAEWVCDLFGTARFEHHALSRLQINYVSDGIEGHSIALDVEENEAGFIVKGADTTDGKIVFESAGEWMRIG